MINNYKEIIILRLKIIIPNKKYIYIFFFILQ